MVACLFALDELGEISSGRVGELWIGMQHLDDVVDQHEDGVA